MNDSPGKGHPGSPRPGQCVLHRNVWYKATDFPVDETADGLFAAGVNQQALETICARSKTRSIRFKGLTAEDLSPLESLSDLETLDITWAHKFSDVSVMKKLKALRYLTISDNKRWHDLSQLEGIGVEELDVSGGIWNTDRYETLEPLATLPNLKLLNMANVKVDIGGLRPLAGCSGLRHLVVGLKFPVEEYAYLSVKLPNTECDAFAPYIKCDYLGDKDCIVVGFRKPLLNSKIDAGRLETYAAEFAAMQDRFRMS